jgi:hypothetical protein
LNTGIIVLFISSILLFLGTILLKKLDGKPDGLLNVDTRDPDKDYYDFVFLIPTDEIPKKKFLKIEVKTKS